ncbi:hypothetical protein D3C85_1413490 [compost metagenome]
MEVFLELDAHLAQVLRAYSHVLEQFRVVVRYLPATHGSADVVMRDPYLVANLARAGEVARYNIALLGFIRNSK